MFGCLSGLLLKCVEDVNGLFESCDVNNPEFILSMDADFANSCANDRHRFPIARFKAALHSIQLVAGLLSRILRKSANGIMRRPEPFDHFHAKSLYTKIYMWTGRM